MIAMMGRSWASVEWVVSLLLGSLLGSIGGYGVDEDHGQGSATYYLPLATFLGAGALIVVAAHGVHLRLVTS